MQVLEHGLTTEERREEGRLAVELEVEMQILIPDDTFTPARFRATVQNVSNRGVMVEIDYLGYRDYQRMLRLTPYIRLCVKTDQDGESRRITGRLVWLDYHGEGRQGGPCHLGISFDRAKPRKFLLAAADGAFGSEAPHG
ncbi:MAG TPA: PilZ domain-containing protein [Candidatus Sumerlaeota bacterium]|nr:PilZ domain-containing protein [Candidatus Sumerlaeota bacterium]